eukprot:428960-Alexandrium_andersonii.AAC.1
MTAGLPFPRRRKGLPVLFMNCQEVFALRLLLRPRAAGRSGAEAEGAALRLQVPPKGRHHEVMIARAWRDLGAGCDRKVRRGNDGVDGSRRALVAP